MLLRPFLPLLLLLAAAPGRAAELRVLPESAEYCEDLATRLARLPRSRQDPARGLGAEGVQLCRRGEIHSGVDRLRRALRAAQPPRHAEE